CRAAGTRAATARSATATTTSRSRCAWRRSPAATSPAGALRGRSIRSAIGRIEENQESRIKNTEELPRDKESRHTREQSEKARCSTEEQSPARFHRGFRIRRG